jgi:hypothetical protein
MLGHVDFYHTVLTRRQRSWVPNFERSDPIKKSLRR